MSKPKLSLLGSDTVALEFDYDPKVVAAVRGLKSRRWNKKQRRWEVHLAHLTEIMDILSLGEEDVPRPIRDSFAQDWAGGRLRVELGILQGRVSGAGVPLEAIDEVTSFHVPGYRFSPKFKAGRWDGKRHLFSKQSRRFPAGLWPRVRAILDREGVAHDVDSPPEAPRDETEIPSPRTALRPYQRRVLLAALGKRRGVIQVATGGGKTILAAHLIHGLGRCAFFFVHTRELLHQSARVLARELGVEVGVLGDGSATLGDVTVATLQTAARVLEMSVPKAARADQEETSVKEKPSSLGDRRDLIRSRIEETPVVFFDECHHVPAETAYKIALRTPKAAFRYGLSATPWRDDGHDLLLEAALGPMICSVSCSDLIEQDYLVAPRIFMETVPDSVRVVRRAPYAEVYRDAIVENQSRTRVIAAQAQKWSGEGKSVLILVAHVRQGENLLALLPQARFIHGSLDGDLRKRCLQDLERKLRPILIATTLADEGLDIPSLDALILAGGGKSATKAYQRVGRALRPAPGKDEALVMDFMDRAPYVEEHSRARLELYRREPAFHVRVGNS